MKKIFTTLLILPILLLTGCDRVAYKDCMEESTIIQFFHKTDIYSNKGYLSCDYLDESTTRYYYKQLKLYEHDFLGYWEVVYQQFDEWYVYDINTETTQETIIAEYKYDNYYLEIMTFDKNNHKTSDITIDKRK